MDALTGTFHIDIKLIIAQLINFIIVLVLAYYVLGKPLMKMMHKRESYIKEGVDNAKNASELIKKTADEYSVTISNAKNEANEIFQEAKKQAEVKKQEMLEEAKIQVSGIIANGNKELEKQKQIILEEAKVELINLTINATNKILAEQGLNSVNQDTINKIKSA
ncbi:ATP synthase F0 subunit B [Candidatus Nomurabacteria bacterium RIFCSPHIGHO2_02_FULL_33_12]|uniref:ATP synthase subunit b n=1 Tax=Candidatus Nomurabacteria bacterium RIFCSPLOWO2_01_FULL_33_17 TaxID=1801764 RepID=A0A1F6WNX9_9BACT|nr:MAG: ATP synthase F0 subunit B [Candidatus Nomurabacteria bacterium RIFCSPHIGHO2_02_FULL_33_12]OGI83445.1 MAG: ATP synthase F0 subunit B [Candidatus Nomurabacteria bacterium RIFCSPLOWO2_01_FULL_33_17]